jgi:hypothetical protein
MICRLQVMSRRARCRPQLRPLVCALSSNNAHIEAVLTDTETELWFMIMFNLREHRLSHSTWVTQGLDAAHVTRRRVDWRLDMSEPLVSQPELATLDLSLDTATSATQQCCTNFIFNLTSRRFN